MRCGTVLLLAVGGVGWLFIPEPQVPAGPTDLWSIAETHRELVCVAAASTPRPGPLARHGGPVRAEALPRDPFQRAATKALRGDYGPLASWQHAAYATGLQLGLTACWPLVLTQYNRAEGRSGQVDRYGRPCDPRTAASNLIPPGYAIWTPESGLRRIRDCGARRNDLVAAKRGGIWVDVWFHSAAAAQRAGVDGWLPTRGAVIPQE